jgi:plasmid stabilization system protein ParE
MNFRVDSRANADFMDVLLWMVRHRRYTMISRLWTYWQAGLTAIQANPRLFGLDPDAPPGVEERTYILRRYGYLIRYQVTATEVVVISFSSGRRRPRHWQHRLTP